MGSIAIGKVLRLEVEHPYKGGDKDQRVVGRGNGMVHLAHDVGSTLVVSCKVAEKGTGNGHIERGRHTLTCHVADDEEELVTLDDEVVEVASHLFGRCHGSEQVKVVALREDGGNHAHLDVVGNGELTLESHLTFGSGFQFLDILLQRFLHILERVAQVQQLILRLDLG